MRPLVAFFALALVALGVGVRGIRRRGGLLASEPPVFADDAARDDEEWKTRAALGAAAGIAAVFAWWIATPWVWAVWCAALGIAAVRHVVREPVAGAPPAHSRGREVALWATAAACALYALVAHRVDADDVFYVNLAVAAIDRPDLPLLAVDTLHGRSDLPIHFPIYRVHSLELAYAAIAWITGLPAILAFHVVGAAAAGAAAPLAHAVLLRTLAPRHWLAITLATVYVLVVVGEPHRWFGNFAFVRIWQGKAIALSVFLPLVAAWAIRFARQPTGRHGALLAAAQIAALGCSASAVWLAPLVAAGALLCAVPVDREGLRRVALGGLASGYVLAAGLLQRGDMIASSPTLKRVYEPGEQLAAAWQRTLGDGALAWLGVVAVAAAWAWCPRGLARRYAITVPLIAVVFLLAPFADAWVRAHLVGPSYWRAMWALPIPLLFAFGIAAPLAFADARRRRIGIAASCALAIGFAISAPSLGWSEANEVVLRAPGAKRPATVARWAAQINERASGRRVLAPPAVSDWIPTWHDHAYPLLVRDYLSPSRERVGAIAYRDRHVLTRYVGGRAFDRETPALFARGLDLYAVDLVCLRHSEHTEAQRAILDEKGFAKTVSGRHYELWERAARVKAAPPATATSPDASSAAAASSSGIESP